MEAKRKLTRPERRALAQMKASFRRTMAEHKFQFSDMLELFGMALRAKMAEFTNRSFTIGQHFFNSHGPGHRANGTKFNPAGTKLARRFIRNSHGSAHYERVYKGLTGKAYRDVSAP